MHKWQSNSNNFNQILNKLIDTFDDFARSLKYILGKLCQLLQKRHTLENLGQQLALFVCFKTTGFPDPIRHYPLLGVPDPIGKVLHRPG